MLAKQQNFLHGLQKFSENKKVLFGILVITLVGFGHTFFYPPIYDDVEFIQNNPITWDPWAIKEIFTSTYTGMMRADITYRPLSVWSWALNRGVNSYFGLDAMHPFSFHLVNIGLHIGVCYLFFLLIRLLKVPFLAASMAVFFYAAMPVHIEAVTGFVGRAELFAAFFGLLFLHGHLRKWPVERTGFFLLLSLFGKESGITYIVVLLAIDFVLRDNLRFKMRKAYLWYLLPLGFWLALRWSVVHGAPYILAFVDNPTIAVSPLQRFCTASRYQLEYFYRMIFPVSLASDSSFNQIPIISTPLHPAVIAFVAIVVVVLGFAWKLRKTHPILLCSALCYAIFFAPTSNFIRPIGSVVGERFTYSPSLMFCLFLSYALFEVGRERFSKKVSVALFSCFIAFQTATTYAQNLTWQNEFVFYETQTKASPNSAKAHYNFGTVLAKQGREEEAIAEYKKAIAIFPMYSEPFYNMGNSLARLNRPIEEVQEAYEGAIRSDPGHLNARGNLALYLARRGETKRATELTQELIALAPGHPSIPELLRLLPHLTR